MRWFVGELVGLLYVLTGVRYRKVRAYDRPGAVLTLCGHNPSVQVLEWLLQWLAKHGFTFVSPDELLKMKAGEWPWRRRIAWLTFDDGWKGFDKKLLPILEKHQAKATIFVPPHEIERGQLWTNSIGAHVPRATVVSLYRAPLGEREAKVAAILKDKPFPRALMTKDELVALSKHPLITLENHTWSHLSCFHRPPDDVVQEVERTQKILAEWTGREPKFVCYPFGHYGLECDRKIKDMGLLGVRSDCGEGTLDELGRYRNMFRNDMGKLETIGRALNAWPRAHVPNAQ